MASTPPWKYPGGYSKKLADIRSLENIEHCVNQGLTSTYAERDWPTFGGYVVIAYYHPSIEYIATMGAALESGVDGPGYEDIAEALGATGSPAAVPYLAGAVWSSPDWDEFHHFAVKCIRALGDIADDSAIETLRSAASTGPEPVREAATAELERIANRLD